MSSFYMKQLENNGADYTISFPVIKDNNHLVYYLVFAASGPHSYGCFKKMKEALNRASVETEGLRFSAYKIRFEYFHNKNTVNHRFL